MIDHRIVDPVKHVDPLPSSADDAAAPHPGEVLRAPRLVDPESLVQLAHRALAGLEELDDQEPHRVPKDSHDVSDALKCAGSTHRHMVMLLCVEHHRVSFETTHAGRSKSLYNWSRDQMTAPPVSRTVRAFADRAEALAHFFARAGSAPRLLAYDDQVGCPVDGALAALEWTSAVGIMQEDDVLHAARLAGETAAAVVERRREGSRVYIYVGPRMDAPPVDPYEGALLYDEPGVRAYEFADRAHAIAHFLRATSGAGAVLALLARRGPEIRHTRRWLAQILGDQSPGSSTQLLAAYFAVSTAGCLFAPRAGAEPYTYIEVGLEP